jgi:hypothetical protein
MLNNMNATKRTEGGAKRNVASRIVIGKSDGVERWMASGRILFLQRDL